MAEEELRESITEARQIILDMAASNGWDLTAPSPQAQSTAAKEIIEQFCPLNTTRQSPSETQVHGPATAMEVSNPDRPEDRRQPSPPQRGKEPGTFTHPRSSLDEAEEELDSLEARIKVFWGDSSHALRSPDGQGEKVSNSGQPTAGTGPTSLERIQVRSGEPLKPIPSGWKKIVGQNGALFTNCVGDPLQIDADGMVVLS